VGATGAATLDSAARPGGEGRADIVAGTGNKHLVFFASLETGGGYLGADARGYGLLSPGVGVRLSRALYLKLSYAGRLLRREGDLITRHSAVFHVAYLFRLTRFQAEKSHLRLGPSFRAEVLYLGRERIGLFSLGVTARFVLMDTARSGFKFR
jgi:hypothetical protein